MSQRNQRKSWNPTRESCNCSTVPMKCVECLDALVAEDSNQVPDHCSYTRTSPNSPNKLISLKSYGSLIVPSQSVVKVVQVTNKILQEKLHQWHLMQTKTLQEMKQQVLQETKLSTSLI
ncbi:Hypothetical predicted protein [Paramuricea clavata]|uniref:Uncharacterized protein n=1 Tax=Paramuricea clavata TaxID=317549 RepID=A0A6S7FQJ5_PARCT|nr:Hypothetical predicted protein [Paramuricea clavata]